MAPLSFVPSVRIALETLRANPLRTLLSTLGIVMGAASLAAVLSLGDGAEQFARERIEEQGLQTILLMPRTSDTIDGVRAPRSDYPVFSVEDGAALAERVAPAQVRLVVEGSGLAQDPVTGKPRGVVVTGLVALLGAGTGATVAFGRDLTAAELRGTEALAVVSDPLAIGLAGGDAGRAVGRDVTIQGRPCRIVGVLPPRRGDRSLVAILPLAAAETVMLPATQPRGRVLRVRADRVEDVPALKQTVRAWTTGRNAAWKDTVIVGATGEERLRQAAQGVMIFKILMGSFTAISLLVGGIGIMNVLLASVAERTREIGIRKAVGASRWAVLAQFLAESVAISVTGSVLGVILGLSGAAAVTAVMRAQTQALIYSAVSSQTIVVSLGAAVVVGLVFGSYPALRAARLSPVDAIMRE